MSKLTPTKGASRPHSVASNIVLHRSDTEFVRHQARLARSGMKQSYDRLTRRLQSGGELGRVVARHPLIAVGAATVAGVVIARAVGGRGSPAPMQEKDGTRSAGLSGWFEGLMLPVVKSVQEMALGAAQEFLHRMLAQWLTPPPSGDRVEASSCGDGDKSPAP